MIKRTNVLKELKRYKECEEYDDWVERIMRIFRNRKDINNDEAQLILNDFNEELEEEAGEFLEKGGMEVDGCNNKVTGEFKSNDIDKKYFKHGIIWQNWDGDLYMLSRIDDDEYVMIRLDNGNRLRGSRNGIDCYKYVLEEKMVPVKDNYNITLSRNKRLSIKKVVERK